MGCLEMLVSTSSIHAMKKKGFAHLWGYEQADYALKRLRQEGVETVKGMLPRLEFEDGSFQGIIASEVLEHMLRRRFFLKEIRRVLTPDGTLIISFSASEDGVAFERYEFPSFKGDDPCAPRPWLREDAATLLFRHITLQQPSLDAGAVCLSIPPASPPFADAP